MPEDRTLNSSADVEETLSVGVELSSPGLRAGVVDHSGGTLRLVTAPLTAGNVSETLAQQIGLLVRDAIDHLGSRASAIKSVGIAWSGDVASCLHTTLGRSSLRDRLSELCGLPVTIVDPLGAAAYGELWVGGGRGLHSVVLMQLDECIRCGVVFRDLPFAETEGRGMSYGHTIVDCSNPALIGDCGSHGRLKECFRERSFTDTARYVAVGIVNIMHTLDPGGVLLIGSKTFGGPQADSGRRFLAGVKDEVGRRAFRILAERTVIDFAALGDDAAYLGAAGLARLEYGRSGAPA